MNSSLTKIEDAYKKGLLSTEALENLKIWLTRPEFDKFVPEIDKLIQEEKWVELEDGFYAHIAIGTGGIRGPIGVGPNRMNTRAIGEAAQGLSQFIQDFGEDTVQKGVVVGHEVRKFSREFAVLCCEVFAGNGIKSYLFESIRSTPELSFSVRHLSTSAGVQITASHNPRTDNGFKFYWSDGGQVVAPLDLKFMELVTGVKEIKRMPYEEALKNGMIQIVGKEIDESYFKEIQKLSLVNSRSAEIVFSPIHGAGSTNVLPILKRQGFTVTVVPEQEQPDENFPTAHGDLINPEYREVMDLPIKFGEKLAADVVICSDPDADRIGVAAKRRSGDNELQFLTGNEVGVAMIHFILSQMRLQGTIPKNGVVISTYVTTSLIADIARSFGVKAVDDLLVGFKFIGELIEKLDDKNDFIFAAEESLGYLSGTFVRDKDSAIASLVVAEMVSLLKDNSKTLVDYLNEIYIENGYYKNILNMVELKGKKGQEHIKAIMMGLRGNPPEELGGMKILSIIDRLDEESRVPEKYKVGKTGDQLTFVLSENGKVRITARPSGTEPKIKYYIQHHQSVKNDLEEVKSRIDTQSKKMEEEIVKHGEKFIKIEPT